MAHKQVNKKKVLVKIHGNRSELSVGEHKLRTFAKGRRSPVLTYHVRSAVAQGSLTKNMMVYLDRGNLTSQKHLDKLYTHPAPYSPEYIQSQIPKAKSIFEMSADEFKAHVRPRTIELTNDRWNNGLYLSTPAGNGYNANQFFHIYKDKSTKLVEVNAKTGEVNFIKNIS